MTGGRPALNQLVRVPTGTRVLRLVNWKGGHWDPDAPVGARLQQAALMEKECKGGPDSYGATFWLARDDKNGGIDVADLEAAEARFVSYGAVLAQVSDVEAIGLHFVFSPQDSDYPNLADAHLTLVWPTGFNRGVRLQLLEILDQGAIREPTPPSNPAPPNAAPSGGPGPASVPPAATGHPEPPKAT